LYENNMNVILFFSERARDLQHSRAHAEMRSCDDAYPRSCHPTCRLSMLSRKSPSDPESQCGHDACETPSEDRPDGIDSPSAERGKKVGSTKGLGLRKRRMRELATEWIRGHGALDKAACEIPPQSLAVPSGQKVSRFFLQHEETAPLHFRRQ